MDSLVAQYSRPADAEEGPSEQDQLELYSGTPELSLKFALPPVAQVCLHTLHHMSPQD
jgi:20S proteasome subunit beta 5